MSPGVIVRAWGVRLAVLKLRVSRFRPAANWAGCAHCERASERQHSWLAQELEEMSLGSDRSVGLLESGAGPAISWQCGIPAIVD